MVSVADYKDRRLLDSGLPHMLISQESLHNLQTHVSLSCKTSSESEMGNSPSTECRETQECFLDFLLGSKSDLCQAS